MQASTQYWKPGEAKPTGGDKESQHGTVGRSSNRKSTKSDRSSKRESNKAEGPRKRSKGKSSPGERRDRRNAGSDSAKRENRGDGNGVRHSNKSRQGSPPASTGKAAVTGPSQGLLAMKFMQRKVIVDEALREQEKKREKLERDFSSSYAKRLKADRGEEKDRLICMPDEQDPALVLVGRRSFGGFNAIAEAAYEACVKDIAAGERLGQPRREGGEGEGISDTEMAERLGKTTGRGRGGRGGRR